MRTKTRNLVYGAMIGAVYAALCYLQQVLLPGTTSSMIQFRVAEALCVLAMFAPAAIPGLTVGCVVFNLGMGISLWDAPIGGLATLLAAWGTYLTRKVTIKGFPLIGLLLPVLTNALLVGLELDYFYGGGFWFNAGCVAVGELGVLLTLGTALYYTIKRHRLLEKI